MKVLWISKALDTGGQGSRAVEMFRGTDTEVRSMARSTTYTHYPVDLPYRFRSLEEEYQRADLIHTRNDFTLYDELARKYGKKPVVIHFHGSKFRGNPHYYLRQMREHNAIGLVSTLDLWLIAPDELEWLPAPYDAEWLASLRQ